MELPEDEEERKKERKKNKRGGKDKISTKLWKDILEIKVEKAVISNLLVTSPGCMSQPHRNEQQT